MMNNSLKFIFVILLSILFVTQSCTATKKDCRGKTKHRLSNGIYM